MKQEESLQKGSFLAKLHKR
uniref:Uncharacterized protein n=1 Tax=Rhizophora mucronata TaxID=61149 RepID=A0A2P2JA06_RHIMU